MNDTAPRRIALVLAAIALLAPFGSTARPLRGDPSLGPPPFLRHLYPPRMVMQSRDAIGLTEPQRSAIAAAIAESRDALVPLETKRDAAVQAVATLVSAPHVDEDAALARAAELMSIEMDIKRAHLRLLIQVKNTLTEEQQAKLEGLRANARDERRQRRRRRWNE